MRARWPTIFLKAGRAWNADNVFKHSAAVSFCTLFSLAPITIIAATVAGVFVGKEEAGHQLQIQVAALIGPAGAELVSMAGKAAQAQNDSWLATATGVVLVLVGATTVFAQLQDSLNAIWGVRTRPSKSGWAVLILHRLVSFALVLTIGFVLLVSLALTTFLTGALGYFSGTGLASPGLLKAADLVVGLVVITGLFALMFKVLPDVRVGWKETWLGAALTAVLFTIGRYLIALYLGHSTIASIYGAAGSLVALLIWVYYSCAIFFFGAEFIRAYRQVAHHAAVEPKETAIVVREEMIRNAARRS
jgi:membrane protein